ncbi:protein roadkill-like [Temnothorax nylanderi]|uniref:protein roadkill-like n=1 Tax=Temnothorax nylanderi TaxID=102681 RepID=UPI003A83D398
MSLEKRKIDKILSSTDQDSAVKSIPVMEEQQISDKEVENISTENKAQTVSSPFLPSYAKSYSQTHIESTILDHTWKIDQFMRFCEIKNTITFPSFPEIGQCEILMNMSRQDNWQINVIKCYILTNNSFCGSCTTTITCAPRQYFSSNFISGHISDMTLLIEFSTERFSFDRTGALIVHCKFEIFHNLINKAIRMNLLPSLTEFSNDVTYFEDSTVDKFRCKDEESIEFVVGKKQYVISRKLLRATNSSYFKYICLTHKEKVKDMTDELVTDNEIQSFEQILMYITTGSIEQRYYMLKNLLTATDKYDVPTLKLACEHYLLRCITIENAVELIQLAFSSNAKFLETNLAIFIKFYIKEITDAKTFKSLSRENSIKIMELIEKSKPLEISTRKFSSPFMADKKFTLANIGFT